MARSGLTACLICYNAAFWLQHTLQPMIDYSDRLIVVEGSPDGGSTDGTMDILTAKLRRTDILIRGVRSSWHDAGNWDIVMRNAYLAPALHGRDWIVMIDSDEMYRPEDWKTIRQATIDAEHTTIRFMSSVKIHFYKDMYHRIVIGPFAAQTHNIWRYSTDAHYVDISTIPLVDGRYLTRYQGLPLNTVEQLHYAYASPAAMYREKQAKFRRRSDGGNLSDADFQQWYDTWQDDRALTNPGIVEYTREHPLQNLDVEAAWSLTNT